ncbi:MAG: MerR family transcriptional regulator [Candidatus Kaelpia aquatica]|nr:MerR family transcriptional regulator [Candidatus Kaelpia aquatica]
MIANGEKKFYSAREVADYLGISKQTLFRYENKNFFPRARRNPINKWREYSWMDMQKLEKILGR